MSNYIQFRERRGGRISGELREFHEKLRDELDMGPQANDGDALPVKMLANTHSQFK
jgi:hypothetical protein